MKGKSKILRQVFGKGKIVSSLMVLSMIFGVHIDNVAMAAMSSEFYNESISYEQSFENITTDGGSIVSPSVNGWTLTAGYNPTYGIANSTATAGSNYGKDQNSWGIKLTAPAGASATDATQTERPSLAKTFVTPAITSGVISYQFDYKIKGPRNVTAILGNPAASINLRQTSVDFEKRGTGTTTIASSLTADTWHTVRVDTQINKINSTNTGYNRNYFYFDGVYQGSFLTDDNAVANFSSIQFIAGWGRSTEGAVEAYFDNVKITKSDVLEVTLLDENFNDGIKPSSLVQTLNVGTASYPDNYNGKMNKSYKMDATSATSKPQLSYTVPKNTNMNNGIISVSYDYFIESPSGGIETRIFTAPDTTTTPLTEVAYVPISTNANGNSSISNVTNKSGSTVFATVSSGLPIKWNNLRYDITLNSDGWGKTKYYVNGVYKGEFDTRYVPTTSPTNQSFYNLSVYFGLGKISYIDNLKVVYKEFASVTSSVGYAKPDDAKNYDYQLYFKNGSGSTITTLQAGDITGFITTNKNEDLKVIAALYDSNNVMKGTQVLTSGNFASGTLSDSSFAFSNVSGTDKIKIFSFKDLTNILPRATKRDFSSLGLSQ